MFNKSLPIKLQELEENNCDDLQQPVLWHSSDTAHGVIDKEWG